MTKERCVEALDRYTFDDIWNSINAEYRINVLIDPIENAYAISRTSVGRDEISLPTERETYFVATCVLASFQGGLKFQPNEWINAEEILKRIKTLVYLYPTSGRLIPRSEIHFYHSSRSNRLFIAVKRSVLIKCFGPEFTQVYMTVYRDSDQENNITAMSFISDGSNAITSPYGQFTLRCLDQNRAGTTIYHNGYEYSELPTTIQRGDVLETICDENVIGQYEVNVSNTTTGYSSKKYSSSREILHCPKEINPNNELITHNTCTLSVIDSNGKGIYLHRTDDNTIGQITHNDLSLKTDTLDAFRDHLDDQTIQVRVRVRTHQKGNPLINEFFYINSLYTQSDDLILRHLRGLEAQTLDFWKAENLEDSFYINAMFGNELTGSAEMKFESYINGLGYYAIASILSSHTFHTSLEAGSKNITVTKPILFQDTELEPLVYLNGRYQSQKLLFFKHISNLVY